MIQKFNGVLQLVVEKKRKSTFINLYINNFFRMNNQKCLIFFSIAINIYFARKYKIIHYAIDETRTIQYFTCFIIIPTTIFSLKMQRFIKSSKQIIQKLLKNRKRKQK